MPKTLFRNTETTNKHIKPMKTTIDNTHRIFLIRPQGFGTQKDIFCNLKDIPKILRKHFEKNEDFKVYHYWNGTLKSCSKKYINAVFAANQINFKIK